MNVTLRQICVNSYLLIYYITPYHMHRVCAEWEMTEHFRLMALEVECDTKTDKVIGEKYIMRISETGSTGS